MPKNKKDLTNFPQSGDDLEISLANSKYPQADYAYVAKLKKEYPSLWKKAVIFLGIQLLNFGQRTDLVTDLPEF